MAAVAGHGGQVRAEFLTQARDQRIEPPSGRRIEWIVRSALDRGEKELMTRICVTLPEQTRARLNELVFGVPDPSLSTSPETPPAVAITES